ncbi:MAG TPA: pseudouridine synthase [Polaromonas sp.]|uniref:RluA family pseudouridine synthase n=1 Tax=Polaromonas sp. TaxID=1869339 RepID=UPI002D347DB7|nr:pseudouridine synthase [Polaromonas sp.]HYW56600.1 pseudouridine synthase [Polaromonas sp.]
MKLASPQNNDLTGNGVVIDGFELLHADASLLVLNKPAGLLSVPGKGDDKQDCLSTRVQQAFPDALIVHRLDMATSGLMVMARGLEMQRKLSHAFAERKVYKLYEAVVQGAVPELSGDGWGVIDLPIAVDWPNRPLRIIDTALGKASTTRWRVLSHDKDADNTRMQLEPLTGRSHQLRVHMQALGHPILGDMLYAPPDVQARSDRLLLHARVLQLVHPASGLSLRFESPAPF